MLKTQTEGLLNSYFNRAFYCGASLMWPFALENQCFGKHLKAFHVQDLRAFHVQDLKAIHVHCAGGPRDAEGAGVWPPSPRRRSLPEFRASPSCVLACHLTTPFLNAFELSRGEVSETRWSEKVRRGKEGWGRTRGGSSASQVCFCFQIWIHCF